MKKNIQLLLLSLLATFFISCTSPNTGPTPEPSTPKPTMPHGAKQCGGIQGLTCGTDEYCNTGIGACGVADALGTCTAKTPFCTREYVPVCGCDGKTYGNKCTAGAAGVSIDHLGQCK